MLAAAIAWGFAGSLPIRVSGRGILMGEGGLRKVVAPVPGQVKTLRATAGESVREGDSLAILAGPSGEVIVRSPFDGRTLELLVREGSVVGQGDPLLVAEPIDPEKPGMLVVAYFSASEGEMIRPGMAVQLFPPASARGEYGFLRGVVTRVAEYPSSRRGMMLTLEDEALVNSLSGEEAPIEVRASLVPDSASPDGYAWSAPAGVAVPLRTGMACEVSVTLDEERPIGLVIPDLKKRLQRI
jgi:HlyD family secretion protein